MHTVELSTIRERKLTEISERPARHIIMANNYSTQLIYILNERNQTLSYWQCDNDSMVVCSDKFKFL